MHRFLIVILAVVFIAGRVMAQGVPTITQFVVDRQSITVDEAEQGETLANFSWTADTADPSNTIVLQYLSAGEWTAYVDAQPLPPSGTSTLPIMPSRSFQEPTYRLAILNAAGEVLTENVVSIPYSPASAAPHITYFFTPEANPADIAAGTYFAIKWDMADRTPFANVRVMQVMDDGSVTPLPDENGDDVDIQSWLPANGSLIVHTLPTESPLHLRLQILDTQTGNVYTESDLTRDGILDFQVNKFTVTPADADRGDTVTLEWDVASTEIETMWINVRYALEYSYGEYVGESGTALPLSGSATYTIPDLPLTSMQFKLMGRDEHTVDVIVRCPYTFFVEGDSLNPCPSAEAYEVEAVYQPFENGFVVEHGGSIWVFTNSADGKYQGLMTTPSEYLIPQSVPPDGLYPPLTDFASTWESWQTDDYPYNDIGWATAPEQIYTMQIQSTLYGAYKDQGATWYYFTLPDGRIFSTNYSVRNLSFNGHILDG